MGNDLLPLDLLARAGLGPVPVGAPMAATCIGGVLVTYIHGGLTLLDTAIAHLDLRAPETAAGGHALRIDGADVLARMLGPRHAVAMHQAGVSQVALMWGRWTDDDRARLAAIVRVLALTPAEALR